MGWACGTNGELRGSCTGSVGMAEGKRQLGRPGVGGRIILKWKF
jgi:hypothetical protein